MKQPAVTRLLVWFTIVYLGFGISVLPAAAEQFIHVTFQLEIAQWGVGDPYVGTISCQVGTNSWQMDGEFFRDTKDRYWTYLFTGTNLVEIEDLPSAPIGNQQLLNLKSGLPGDTESFTQITTSYGQRWTQNYESLDGNLDGGLGKKDRLCHSARVAWLAFCSGPCLKKEGRRIYPPTSFWKEHMAPDWLEKTETFKDALALPSSVLLYLTNGQPILNYHVTASTNLLGWEFPLAFKLTQYLPRYEPGTQRADWKLFSTATGKVTAIGVGTPPKMPTVPQKTVQK